MGGSSHHGDNDKEIIEEEDWGDDVSIIERSTRPSASVVIFKIIIALLMIGACAGALVYSVINSDDGPPPVPYESPEEFPIRTSQECQNGTLTQIYRVNGTTASYKNYQWGCTWIQDDTRKRLYMRVGLTNKDFQFAYYVFENITFFQLKQGCGQQPGGYDEFIESQGLDFMAKLREEDIKIDGEYKEVTLYEGEPPLDALFDNAHPSLVRGTADAHQTVVYGWQKYFSHESGSSMYKEEYFFPDMKTKAMDFSIFDVMPEECINPPPKPPKTTKKRKLTTPPMPTTQQ